MVLVGESDTNKTSIISRFISNHFGSALGSTPGANFTTKTMYFKEEKKSIRFEIWDTAGEEKYRPLAKGFFKNANAVILVYSITSRYSFEELKNY